MTDKPKQLALMIRPTRSDLALLDRLTSAYRTSKVGAIRLALAYLAQHGPLKVEIPADDDETEKEA
ncbi:MAG: hypothetical protein WC683_08540 [bacterium]